MDIYELRSRWARNVNAEYIIPDINGVIASNVIIPHKLIEGVSKSKFTVSIGTKSYHIKIKEVKEKV